MKKQKVMLLVIVLLVNAVMTGCHTVNNVKNPELIVPDICSEMGYEIISEDKNSLDDSYYDGYVCQIALDEDISMQVITGFSGESSSWVSMTIYNELESLESKSKQLEVHYDLMVNIANEFIANEISIEDINAFIEDDLNVSKCNETYDGLFYFVEKKSSENNLTYNYSVYTSSKENNSKNSIEEYFEITTIQK